MKMLWSRPPETKKPPGSGKTDQRRFKYLLIAGILCTLLLLNVSIVAAAKVAAVPTVNPAIEKAFVEHKVMKMHNITSAQRFAAAEVAKAKGLKVAAGAALAAPAAPLVVPQPGGIPDYFGANSNYALSQLPGRCQWNGNHGYRYQEVR